VKVKGVWEGKSAGGSLAFPSWRYNPQIFVSVSQPAQVSLTLSQDIKTKHFIGLIVAKSNGQLSRQLCLPPDQVVERTEFEQNQNVKVTVAMEPSVTYFVIPCTYEPGCVGRYMLTFTALTDIKVSELPATEEWRYVTLKGEWNSKTAGGCLGNQELCATNPQYVMKADVATRAVALVTQNERDDRDDLGLYVFETKTVKSRMAEFLKEDLRGNADFARKSEACVEFLMEPKKIYLLIPCTFEPGHENQFELTVFSNNDIKIHELKPSERSKK
jgi:hypothetical protein